MKVYEFGKEHSTWIIHDVWDMPLKRRFVTQQYHYPRSALGRTAFVHINGHNTPVEF